VQPGACRHPSVQPFGQLAVLTGVHRRVEVARELGADLSQSCLLLDGRLGVGQVLGQPVELTLVEPFAGRTRPIAWAPMTTYRVESVHWDGGERGARNLTDLFNEWAEQGWRVRSVVPTRADTSVRALVASASADTSEFAVVLERD